MCIELADVLGQLAKIATRVRTRAGLIEFESATDARVALELQRRATQLKDSLGPLLVDLGSTNDCISPLRPVRGAVANLVCVHPLNANVYDYRHVARSMSAKVSVYGVDALRSVVSGYPMTEVEEMSEHYFKTILQSDLTTLPVALYGGSSGGFVALEIARKMRAAGISPLITILGDSRDGAWDKSANYEVFGDRVLWIAFLEALFPDDLLDLTAPSNNFWTHTQSERLAELSRRLSDVDIQTTSLAINPKLLSHYLESFRRYTGAYRRHKPMPYLGRSLFLKVARSAPRVSEEITSMLQGNTRLQVIEGHHAAMFRPPVSTAVANVISAAIDEATLTS